MKKGVWVMLALCGAMPPAGASAEESGAEVYARVIREYPCAKPFLTGFMTGAARLEWFLPTSAWTHLSPAQQAAVVGYMPTLVARARQHPRPFFDLPKDAPIPPRAFVAVRDMQDGQWVIGVGRLRGTGPRRTVLLDQTVVCGPQARACEGEAAATVLARREDTRAKPGMNGTPTSARPVLRPQGY